MGEYGINPNLIAVITGQKLEDIPPQPTAVNLPGKYGKLVAKNIDKVSTSGINNYYRLQCGYCGKTQEYNLGTIAVDAEGIEKYQSSEEKNILDTIQASAYFRCKHCNGAGNWKLMGTSLLKFTFKWMTKMIFIPNKKNQPPYKFIRGMILVDGDFKPHWGTDAEEHFLAKLAQDPQDEYRWNRLGNYFYQHDRADLATVAFEHSLQIDNMQMESCFSLGMILYDIELWEEAARYLRQALVYAHRYRNLQALKMRDVLVDTLEILFEINEITRGRVPPLPTEKEMAVIRDEFERNRVDHKKIVLMDFEISSEDPESLLPLAEMFMGKRRMELPVEDQRFKLSDVHAELALKPVKKTNKKATKKNKHKN